MSVRPLVLNGMIQNTHELPGSRTNEANLHAQDHIAMQGTKEAQESIRVVHSAQESDRDKKLDPDQKGNGGGTGKKRQKKKKEDQTQKSPDGRVLLKDMSPRFDLKI